MNLETLCQDLSTAKVFFIAFGIVITIGLIIAIAKAPNGKWIWGQVRSGLDGDNIRELMNEQHKLEESIVHKLPSNSKFDEQAYIVQKVQAAIQYAIGRHDWYEQQRNTIYQMTLAAASFMFVLCGLALGIEEQVPFHFGFFSVFAVLIAIIGIVAALWRYNKELDADRPYRSVSDIRFWYFRYNLPEHSDQHELNGNVQKAKSVLEQRKLFFERIEGHGSLTKSLREDLEQVFILQVLQRYKSESLTQMRWGLLYMVAAFCTLMLASMFSTLW